MALAFVSQASGSVKDSSSLTFSVTVASGSDRALVIAVGWTDTLFERTVSSVTFDGVNATKVTDSTGSGSLTTQNGFVEHWVLTAPNVTTANVVVTFSGSVDVGLACTQLWTGVSQSTPTSNGANGTDGGSNPALVVTSVSGRQVLGAMVAASADVTDMASNDDQRAEVQLDDVPIDLGLCASSKASAASSTTLSWSCAGNGDAESGFQLNPALTNYTLGAGQGSYALAGQAATTRVARLLGASWLTVQLAGQAVSFPGRQRVIVADQVGFTLAGQAAAVKRGFGIQASSVTFASSGQANVMRRAAVLVGAQASYALTGQAAGVLRGRLLTATQVEFVMNEFAAGVRADRKLPSAGTSFALTGIADSMRATRVTQAGQGSFALSGIAAGVFKGRLLIADPSAYVYVGQAAGLSATRKLTSAFGSFALAGQGAIVARGYKLPIVVGTFSWDGFAASLRLGKGLQAGLGIFSTIGNPSSLKATRLLSLTQGAFSLTGVGAGFDYSGVGGFGVIARFSNMLRSGFAAAFPTLATQFDNAPFVVPQGTWVRMAIEYVDELQRTFGTEGTRRHRTLGHVRCEVRVEAESGEATALDQADAIADYYRHAVVGDVVFEVPKIKVVGREDKWWRVDVIAPFTADSSLALTQQTPWTSLDYRAIADVARARYATTIGGDVQYDDHGYDHPSDLWTRVTMLFGDTRTSEIGSFVRTVGALVAQIYSKAENGDMTALALANQIHAAFRCTSAGGITWRSPHVEVVGREGKWWRINVFCPFYADRTA